MLEARIGVKIVGLVGGSLAVGLLAALFLLMRLITVTHMYQGFLEHEVREQDAARVMQLAFKKEVQAWKDMLLRGRDVEMLKKYHGEFDDYRSEVARTGDALAQSISDPNARATLREFLAEHQALGSKYAAAFAAFEASNGADFAAADSIVKGQDRKPTDLCDSIVKVLNERVETLDRDQQATAFRQQLPMGLVMAICFGMVATASGVLIRSTNRELHDVATELRQNSEQVMSAASQVSTSSQALSQGSSRQAAALEETSASMEEMASMTRQNAENARGAAREMSEADEQVRASGVVLDDMVRSMTAIGESSQQVAKIIKTIDEIAFQTNILALNAAVEAARAGEAGMGFAVVADEVRSLAQRSAQAAKDTATLIEQALERANAGSAKVEQVSAAIAGITDSVAKVKGLVDQVSTASLQQTQGIDQVLEAIAQIEKITQATAATAEESAAASEELSAQAESAMAVVYRLERLVRGDARTVTALPSAGVGEPTAPTTVEG